MLLNLEGNAIEVFLFVQQNCYSIIIPKIPKMRLNTISQLNRDVRWAAEGLILNFFNQNKPPLKHIFVVVEIRRFHAQNNVDEIVHENWKKRDTEYLNYGA